MAAYPLRAEETFQYIPQGLFFTNKRAKTSLSGENAIPTLQFELPIRAIHQPLDRQPLRQLKGICFAIGL